jgi:cytochrome c2
MTYRISRVWARARRTEGKGALVLAAALLFASIGAACKDPKKDPPGPTPSASASTLASAAPTAAAPSASQEPAPTGKGDPAHGKVLMAKYECNRCHDGTGLEAATPDKQCVHCHTDIVDGKFKAQAASLARWKPLVAPLADVPTLTATAKRFSRTYVETFLLEPNDLRPKLVPSMPRLGITRADARDIAAYLVPEEVSDAKPTGDASRGRALLDSKGCGSCHAFTGVAALQGSAIPVTVDQKTMARAQLLAPDLRYTRDRYPVPRIVEWLKDPKKVKPDTTMPSIPLTPAEAADIATYLVAAELAPLPTPVAFVRLPPLERKVTFEEVDKKVFHKTCWHCHAEPDFSIGDGGPGNSGGFGFKPRGLNLASYEGVSAGILDKKTNDRVSAFAKGPDGIPMLVKALIARHSEASGASTGDVRGMPLGMPPLSAEDIQLVDTWVTQGRPK